MDTRFYQASGLDIERIARDLEHVYYAQGHQVQHFGNKERIVIQLREGSDFEALIGMQAALTLTLQNTPSGVMAVIGQQQWVDKAAIGALGMFFIWPLMITAGAGLIRQAGLEGQVFSALDSVVLQQKPDVKVDPVPAHMQERMYQEAPPPPFSNVPPWSEAQPRQGPPPRPGTIPCANCQEVNEVGDLFCSHCGKPLTPPKKRCSQCSAETKANAAFCPKCGNSFAQGEAQNERRQ